MSDGAAPAEARKFSLHYLRGAAALCVLFYHASFHLSRLRGDPGPLAIFGPFFGGFGVAAFFALSGYLMAQVVERDEPARFLVARMARIYPPFLFVVALFWALFALLGEARGVNLPALSLIPSGPRGYFLTVEWTLLYEMTYYVALAATGFLGLARWREWLVGVWAAAILLAYASGASPPNDPPLTLGAMALSVVNLPFALGYLSAGALRRGLAPPLLWLPAAGFAAASFLAPDSWFRLLVGLAAAFLVAALARAPDIRPRAALAAPGGRLGDASYALYLVHAPMIALVDAAAPAATPAKFVWFAYVATSLALSLALGPLDVASHRRIKRGLDAARRRTVATLAFAYLALFASVALVAEVGDRGRRAALTRATSLAVTGAAAPLSGGTRAGFETVEKRADGSWAVAAYGVDLDHPSLGAHFAILDQGRVVDIAQARRFRPEVARALGREDLARRRIGFWLGAPAGARCAGERLEARLILADGRVFRVPDAPLAALCR